jgi:FkbM family methyltransferase
MKKMWKLVKKIGGKKGSQRFWEILHKASLIGMNIGEGGNYVESGEDYVLNFIKKSLNENNKPIIFDVGANIGDYTLLIKSMIENSEIHAFEPSLKTFTKLSEKVKAQSKIVLNNFGFGDKAEKIKLFYNSELSGLASLYQRRLDHFNKKFDQSEVVEIRTIDQYCQEKNIAEIDFLKLDVEGNEIKTLVGAKKMLDGGKINFIQFEFGGCNIDSRTFFQDFYYLLKDKYDIYRVLKNGLWPITKYREEYEIFVTTNFLAISHSNSGSNS